MHFSETTQIQKIKDASPAGLTTIDSAVVDMASFEGVCFLVNSESIDVGGVQSLQIRQGPAEDLADAADVAGGCLEVQDHAGGQAFWLDIRQPRERYLKLRILRSSQNSAWGPIWAFRYGRGVKVVNDVPGVLAGKAL